MTCAKAFTFVSARRTKMDGGSVVGLLAGEEESYVRADIPQTIAGYGCWILPLNRGGSAHEEIRNAKINTETMRKIIPGTKTKVVNAAVTTGASFKASAKHPAGIKSGVILAGIRNTGRWTWSLRVGRKRK